MPDNKPSNTKLLLFLCSAFVTKVKLKILFLKMDQYHRNSKYAADLMYKLWLLSKKRPWVTKFKLYHFVFQRLTIMKYSHERLLPEHQAKTLFLLKMLDHKREKVYGIP